MNITHPQHQSDYDAGFSAALDDIKAFGKDKAAAKWRMENPEGVTFSSLAAYYYAKSGLDAICAA